MVNYRSTARRTHRQRGRIAVGVPLLGLETPPIGHSGRWSRMPVWTASSSVGGPPARLLRRHPYPSVGHPDIQNHPLIRSAYRRNLLAAIICVGFAFLSGCTQGDSPAPVTETPAPVVTTPTPTPTPTWRPEQQGAIDGVNAYLAKWTEISQNVATADWSEIYRVADMPAVDYAYQAWAKWKANGEHLVGGPVFTPETVEYDRGHEMGDLYAVTGCFAAAGGYIADSEGRQTVPRRGDQGTMRYEVVHTSNDAYIVVGETVESDVCQ